MGLRRFTGFLTGLLILGSSAHALDFSQEFQTGFLGRCTALWTLMDEDGYMVSAYKSELFARKDIVFSWSGAEEIFQSNYKETYDRVKAEDPKKPGRTALAEWEGCHEFLYEPFPK
jgi:hypothetical protein